MKQTVLKRALSFCCALVISEAMAQSSDTLYSEKPPYNKKEEIIYQNKRYRIHNNYLTLGGGYLASSLRDDIQSAVAADYQFHIKRQQFQIGGMMSGEAFLSNNYVQAHLGYGYRLEKYTSNFAVYAGPTYFSGVAGKVGQPEDFFNGFGFYLSVQAVYKFAYDIGLGLELFQEVNYKQKLIGVKAIVFFSGAYRGVKKRVNPNVRTPAR